MEKLNMKQRRWMTDEQAEHKIKLYELIHEGISYEDAFDEVYEFKFDEATLKKLEEADAFYESTGTKPPKFTEEDKANIRRICEAAEERIAKLPKRLYEIDEDEYTITEIIPAAQQVFDAVQLYYKPVKELCSGIFWVITDSRNSDNYLLLTFRLPCDEYGNLTDTPELPPNSRKGKTYNHKLTWEAVVRNDSTHNPYNKKAYDYYPRGRIDISNNKAIIYINPHLNRDDIINDIKRRFGLNKHTISKVRVFCDNSVHYQCWIDRE